MAHAARAEGSAAPEGALVLVVRVAGLLLAAAAADDNRDHHGDNDDGAEDDDEDAPPWELVVFLYDLVVALARHAVQQAGAVYIDPALQGGIVRDVLARADGVVHAQHRVAFGPVRRNDVLDRRRLGADGKQHEMHFISGVRPVPPALRRVIEAREVDLPADHSFCQHLRHTGRQYAQGAAAGGGRLGVCGANAGGVEAGNRVATTVVEAGLLACSERCRVDKGIDGIRRATAEKEQGDQRHTDEGATSDVHLAERRECACAKTICVCMYD